MITVQRLSQLRYLKHEIEAERERLVELRGLAEFGARQTDGMPKGSRKSNRVARFAVEMSYLQQLIADNMQRAVCELLINIIIRYPLTVADECWLACATICAASPTSRTVTVWFTTESESMRTGAPRCSLNERMFCASTLCAPTRATIASRIFFIL